MDATDSGYWLSWDGTGPACSQHPHSHLTGWPSPGLGSQAGTHQSLEPRDPLGSHTHSARGSDVCWQALDTGSPEEEDEGTGSE